MIIHIFIVVCILLLVLLIIAGIIDYLEFKKDAIETTRMIYKVTKIERLETKEIE
jgi:hypothetical protein